MPGSRSIAQPPLASRVSLPEANNTYGNTYMHTLHKTSSAPIIRFCHPVTIGNYRVRGGFPAVPRGPAGVQPPQDTHPATATVCGRPAMADGAAGGASVKSSGTAAAAAISFGRCSGEPTPSCCKSVRTACSMSPLAHDCQFLFSGGFSPWMRRSEASGSLFDLSSAPAGSAASQTLLSSLLHASTSSRRCCAAFSALLSLLASFLSSATRRSTSFSRMICSANRPDALPLSLKRSDGDTRGFFFLGPSFASASSAASASAFMPSDERSKSSSSSSVRVTSWAADELAPAPALATAAACSFEMPKALKNDSE
eukprot:7120725-Prymnesium_polylepis.1